MILLSTKRSSITISFVILSFTLLLLVSIQQQANAAPLPSPYGLWHLTNTPPNGQWQFAISDYQHHRHVFHALNLTIDSMGRVDGTLVGKPISNGFYNFSTGKISFNSAFSLGHNSYSGYFLEDREPFMTLLYLVGKATVTTISPSPTPSLWVAVPCSIVNFPNIGQVCPPFSNK